MNLPYYGGKSIHFRNVFMTAVRATMGKTKVFKFESIKLLR